MSARGSKPIARPAPVRRKRGQHGAIKPRPAGTLKDAVLQLVDANGGHVRSADITETVKGTVQRWTDADGDTASVFPGVNKVRLLEAAADDPIVTRFLATEAGYALVKVLEPQRASEAIAVMAAVAGGEVGDVMRAVADAMQDDGHIDAREAGRIIKEIDEAMGALMAARSWVSAFRNGG